MGRYLFIFRQRWLEQLGHALLGLSSGILFLEPVFALHATLFLPRAESCKRIQCGRWRDVEQHVQLPACSYGA